MEFRGVLLGYMSFKDVDTWYKEYGSAVANMSSPQSNTTRERLLHFFHRGRSGLRALSTQDVHSSLPVTSSSSSSSSARFKELSLDSGDDVVPDSSLRLADSPVTRTSA